MVKILHFLKYLPLSSALIGLCLQSLKTLLTYSLCWRAANQTPVALVQVDLKLLPRLWGLIIFRLQQHRSIFASYRVKVPLVKK